MKARALPPLEALQELLHYDPDTGTLTWKQQRGRARAGDVAGFVGSNAYWYLRFGGTNWLAHRIIWKLQTGADPEPGLVIDHLNGNRADNRWSNLRVTSQSVNVGRKRCKERALPAGVRRTNPSYPGERYAARVGYRVKYGLTLEQATALAREWREELYPGSL
jgi:hypothetical protein